jgi:hypothetical protein
VIIDITPNLLDAAPDLAEALLMIVEALEDEHDPAFTQPTYTDRDQALLDKALAALTKAGIMVSD